MHTCFRYRLPKIVASTGTAERFITSVLPTAISTGRPWGVLSDNSNIKRPVLYIKRQPPLPPEDFTHSPPDPVPANQSKICLRYSKYSRAAPSWTNIIVALICVLGALAPRPPAMLNLQLYHRKSAGTGLGKFHNSAQVRSECWSECDQICQPAPLRDGHPCTATIPTGEANAFHCSVTSS